MTVPQAYSPVEYIQGNGSNYIDTGIVPQGTELFELDFTSKTAPSAYTVLFGTRDIAAVTDTKNAWLGFDPSKFFIRFGTVVPSETIPVSQNTAYHVSVSLPGDQIMINNSNYAFQGSSISGITRSIYLGGMNSGNALGNTGTVQYKGFYIVRQGELVFNGIPARRNSDGKCGMYDTVSGEFLISATGTAFTCP